MARSRPGARRSVPTSPDSSPPVRSLASSTLPRVWQGVGYRPLPDASAARPLFDFAAVTWPHGDALALAWGAHAGDGLLGAIVGERAARSMMLHGPVVPDASGRERPESDPLEIAAQLVAAALDHATALDVETIFTRPQGLDRVWVRFGFIPIPESALPEALAGRAGAGLYAWRGGSALWTFRERATDRPEGAADRRETAADRR